MELFLIWSLMIGYAFADYNDFFDDKQPSRAQSCDCGWSKKGRIINGKETEANAYPWMVALLQRHQLHAFCGGVILTIWHILTVAHCTNGRSPSNIIAAIGAHNLSNPFESSPRHDISDIMQHKWYKSHKVINDISLLVVKYPIEFNQHVGRACLLNRKIDLVGQSVKALGWGQTEKDLQPSDELKEADLNVIPVEECRNQWRNAEIRAFEHIDEAKILCTYHPIMDTIQGDSGGPLLWLDRSTNCYTVVALITRGSDSRIKVSGGHTKVTPYLAWIRGNIQKSKPGTNFVGSGEGSSQHPGV